MKMTLIRSVTSPDFTPRNPPFLTILPSAESISIFTLNLLVIELVVGQTSDYHLGERNWVLSPLGKRSVVVDDHGSLKAKTSIASFVRSSIDLSQRKLAARNIW
ncbi:hypothetical protein Pla22_43130 [Rubripirellula amarantea]|uniref:Uncharacterized protein n=1 Tax=Rubripirellula amarantea TaxID=2527999 RepID=A0A5C5WG77_9BACT|nr:hypothetical protein Pla22_43130 [Rubripirellula amarantea]